MLGSIKVFGSHERLNIPITDKTHFYHYSREISRLINLIKAHRSQIDHDSYLQALRYFLIRSVEKVFCEEKMHYLASQLTDDYLNWYKLEMMT